jgi:predicted nuclease of restriction endonuclease-like (RecB) superfamily
VTVARQLENAHGKNFTERNVRRMMQFAEQFSDMEIVSPVATQLSWSHFIELLSLKKHEAQLFYIREIANGNLGKRELRRLIATKSFERTEIANAQITVPSEVPFNTFKDPYILEFLNLKDGFLENDLETAILRELERFILEMGNGFAFVERQKRIIVDANDYHLDLLFYHRTLRRLVAIDLKLGAFEPQHKGQMELYLKWLDRYERQEGENTPIGLILCTESSKELVELLEMHKDGIIVAEYWSELPPKHLLEQKILSLMVETKERIERNKLFLENK